MSALREAIAAQAPLVLALGGLLIGFLLGLLIYASNFCAMGSLADIHNFGDYRRFRAWVLAAATALAGTTLLDALGVVDLSRSMYLAPTFNWLGHSAGGLMFGVGMVLAGGCPSRNLARAAGGDLRALIVLIVLGLAAFMAIAGVLAPLRAMLEETTRITLGGVPGQSLGDLFGRLTGLSSPIAKPVLAMLIAPGALGYCLADGQFRKSARHVASGLGVGGLVVAAWMLTGLAYDEMAAHPTPPTSLTYIRPVGDTLQWLSLYTATPMPGFGVASVLGALLGAFAAARSMDRFRLATFADANDTVRHLCG
ncbi:MAG TPA: YeeE/YedE family protein, partial [Hyphomicrobiaceae bacterium]|nr:YeeE/YedE family protein [Hyphomicrobiaceae bacterium]